MTQQFPESSQLPQPHILYKPNKKGNANFFDHLNLSTKEVNILRQEIAQLAISHQLDDKTINIPTGQKVKQIMIIQIFLAEDHLNLELLKALDERLGFYALFEIHAVSGEVSYVIHFKESREKVDDGRLFKVIKRFQTTTFPDIPFGATDLDDFYNKLSKTIGQDQLEVSHQDVKSAIEVTDQIQKLEKKSQVLRKKMYAAKSMRQQMAYKKEYQELQLEIKTLKN
ncbi:DUF4391 domain-containing protein [Streptococcus hyovaginalis]|uniref:DUF4391 domain-containing protein n=1 Tax=Streptococcus hyovaginalis TaxID=149015 RepID=UPI003B3A7AF0